MSGNQITLSRSRPIGIFDSGVGGLTVVAEIFKQLPREDVIYFGDTGRYPYGVRSAETVQSFARQDVNFLLRFKVKLIVVACNTASALALETIKEQFQVPIIGVIEPGARKAVAATEMGRVGVIGTVGTIRSNSYSKAIHRWDKSIKVFSLPCPLLVALAEEGYIERKATYLIVQDYLKPLKKHKIDTLVLGCTHYPLLKKVIGKVMGKRVHLIDSAEETAKVVKAQLEKLQITSPNRDRGQHKFFVSDTPDKFLKIGKLFFRGKVAHAEKIDISRF